MDRLALSCVVVGFALVLSLVATLVGGLVPNDSLALPAVLGAGVACALLMGGLFVLERNADARDRPGRRALARVAA